MFWLVEFVTLFVIKKLSTVICSFNSIDCNNGIPKVSFLENSKFGSVVNNKEGFASKSIKEICTKPILLKIIQLLFNYIIYLSCVWFNFESYTCGKVEDVVIKFSIRSLEVMVPLVLLICDIFISVLADKVFIRFFCSGEIFLLFFWFKR